MSTWPGMLKSSSTSLNNLYNPKGWSESHSRTNIRHRRAAAAAAAAQRRALNLQLGFNPNSIFDDPGNAGPGPTGPFGGLSDFFPQRSPSISNGLPYSSTSASALSFRSASSTSSTSSSSSSSSSSMTSSSSSSTISSMSTIPTITVTIITVSISHTSSLSTSTTAASTTDDSADTSSGMSTSAVVGRIGASIVMIAVIGFAVTYFIHRARKCEAEGAFKAQNFRRSAMFTDDPPTHKDTVARRYNPPQPPAMVQRYNANASPSPTFGTQYGVWIRRTVSAGHFIRTHISFQSWDLRELRPCGPGHWQDSADEEVKGGTNKSAAGMMSLQSIR
ncbi:hypothetical protein CVT25_008235 [Psilocybe cyanescens]|uniref:Uncharacterized protein n=1 Tax=Psilocybe cyanescens TaxID=93625 RepID=A0A409XGB3_PSICY|nr:hypothetical protein CVT25_008235 [Psilocybe cyanescens]